WAGWAGPAVDGRTAGSGAGSGPAGEGVRARNRRGGVARVVAGSGRSAGAAPVGAFAGGGREDRRRVPPAARAVPGIPGLEIACHPANLGSEFAGTPANAALLAMTACSSSRAPKARGDLRDRRLLRPCGPRNDYPLRLGQAFRGEEPEPAPAARRRTTCG